MHLKSAVRKLIARPFRKTLLLVKFRIQTLIEEWLATLADPMSRTVLQRCRSIIISTGLQQLQYSCPTLEDILSHRFVILGSEPTAVDYALTAAGVEGHRYAMSLNIGSFDRSGGWLAEILLPVHQKVSRELWSNITEGYRPIDWQQDFKCGYRWSQKVYHKRIAHLPGLPGVDIKVPWELARLQHLPCLALAACTCDEPGLHQTIATEFRNQVLDFVATNPVGMGVNWSCAMDVAIRAANILVAYDLLHRSCCDGTFDEYFDGLFSTALWHHGNFIRYNLESNAPKNNHYLADVAGLFIIALYLDEKTWQAFAIKELQHEIQRQFHDDGTNFEASIPYHKFAAEMVLYPVLLAISCNGNESGRSVRCIAEDIFGPAYLERLYHIIDSFHYLLKPDGTLPQIGDNDSGQFFALGGRKPLDCRHLLALGAVLFSESRWKSPHHFNAYETPVEVAVFLGDTGISIWNELGWTDATEAGSKGFNDSGWYILRNSRTYLLISCERYAGKNLTVHRHNDCLSFELMIDGESVVVDPGSYLYGPLPEQRNHFRSVVSHNTLVFVQNGNTVIEHNEFDGLFSAKPVVEVTEFEYDAGSLSALILHPLFKCKRHFSLLDNGVRITNHVSCCAEVEWYNNLLFAPGISTQQTVINGTPLAAYPTSDFFYSSSYGIKLPATQLKLRAEELCISYGVPS